MTSRTKEHDLKESLHQGRRIYGTLVTSTSPKSIEALADLDIDCVMIDTEHIPLDWHDLGWMCHAYRSVGVVPIIRIPRADPFEACRVLDMGAGGLVTAYVETLGEAMLLRGATKLRPLKGGKLEDILSGRRSLEGGLADYVRRRNENNILLLNIESVAAVEALDQILTVPDLDGILIGPHDLSCSLGHPEEYDHPLFEKTIGEIIEKVRAKNVGVGIHNLPTLEQEIKWSRAGANLILHRSDIALFRHGLHDNLKVLRDAVGEDTVTHPPKDLII